MKKMIFLCFIVMIIFNHTHLVFAQTYDYKDIMQVKHVNEYENDTTVPLKDLDSVIFGQYPQSDITGVTKEPIEWLVLTIDKDNDKALLLSKYIITNISNKGDLTYAYENAEIRSFLNNDFYNEAFTDEEKKLILDTDYFKSYDQHNYISTDKIFPPTEKEIVSYLTPKNHIYGDCKYRYSIPTPYAQTIPEIFGNNVEYLKIRDYQYRTDREKWKNGFGNYVTRGTHTASFNTRPAPGPAGIRPAMWIRLNSYNNVTDTNNLNEVKNGWIGNYYFENNVLYTNKWAEYNGDLYYLGPDGMMLRNQWIDNTYYVDNDGKMLRSAITPDGTLVGADGAKIQLQ